MSCRHHIHIISNYNSISFYNKISLKFHFILCKNCKFYFEHLQLINTHIKILMRKITKIDESEMIRFNNKIYSTIVNEQNNESKN